MLEIVDAAAQAGFSEVDRLWRLSLADAEHVLTAFAASRRAAMERDDRAAWMTGYYCAIAQHAPRKYPRRPRLIRNAPAPMTEAQMKRALMTFASERRNEDDIGNVEN